MLDVKDETCVPLITENYGDWTDDIAVTLGSDVLRRCIGYPVERVRQRLYKTWLARFAAQEWPDTFDQDLLECVVATPSPSDPTKPLFGDLFLLAARRPARLLTCLESWPRLSGSLLRLPGSPTRANDCRSNLLASHHTGPSGCCVDARAYVPALWL
ncbi:hypothetical protein V5799_015758 [Amblyomma americanum]|uniref:Uncharacterized protein n=1 Tax=Amblyomma americanum TaxID=6943 RepID=A0AAQ4F7S9_AMBAM